jgi:hypothetical protein
MSSNMTDKNTIYVTNGITQDGFGSRLQRCFQVMCFVYKLQSQGINIQYIHTPFSYDEDNVINEDRTLGVSIRKDFSLANSYPYDDIEHDGYMKRSLLWDNALSFNDKTVYDLDLSTMEIREGYNQLLSDMESNTATGHLYVIRYLHIEYDNGALDINSFKDYRDIILNKFDFFKKKTYSGREIAVHIRRKDCIDKADRYIDDSVYIGLLSEMQDVKECYNVTLYTQEVGFEKSNFVGWNVILDTEIVDWEVFRRFVFAEYLILGSSSFSYAAGLLNSNTVVYIKKGHTELRDWLSCDEYIKRIKQACQEKKHL